VLLSLGGVHRCWRLGRMWYAAAATEIHSCFRRLARRGQISAFFLGFRRITSPGPVARGRGACFFFCFDQGFELGTARGAGSRPGTRRDRAVGPWGCHDSALSRRRGYILAAQLDGKARLSAFSSRIVTPHKMIRNSARPRKNRVSSERPVTRHPGPGGGRGGRRARTEHRVDPRPSAAVDDSRHPCEKTYGPM